MKKPKRPMKPLKDKMFLEGGTNIENEASKKIRMGVDILIYDALDRKIVDPYLRAYDLLVDTVVEEAPGTTKSQS